jgi:hypothetical protein
MNIYRSLYNDDPHHTAYDNAVRTQPRLASEPSKTPSAGLKTAFAPYTTTTTKKEPNEV